MSRQYRTSGNKKASRTRRQQRRAPTKRRKQAQAAAAEIQMPLDRDELIRLSQDSLHTFAVEMGLTIAGRLLEDEVEQLCGARYQHQQGRIYTRFGRQGGVVTLAGQKLSLDRPRVRRSDGRGEAELPVYATLQRPEAMPESALRRMVRGVSCRDYEQVIDLACDGFGVKRSSVSRSFVRASAAAVKQLAQRRFDGLRFAALLIDGVEYAGETMIVALGILADGQKRVLGLRQGATENAEVVASLLEELRERGVATAQPTLFVLDGSKALAAGVKRVWGRNAVIQRCQVHKKRNVLAHVPEEHREEIERDLHLAWSQTDHEAARAQLQHLVRRLRQISPDAAASLAEGLDETITVLRLRVPQTLRKTLKSTNPIESALDVVRTVTQRVKRWRSGDMRQRWCVAGLLRAEEKFKRVKGHKQIPQLLAALDAELLDTKRRTG
jgi:transposase-like protein